MPGPGRPMTDEQHEADMEARLQALESLAQLPTEITDGQTIVYDEASGLWKAQRTPGSIIEIATVQNTVSNPVSDINNATTTPLAIPDLDFVIEQEEDSGPYQVECFVGFMYNTTALGGGALSIFRGSTAIASAVLPNINSNFAGSFIRVETDIEDPAPGSYTYSARFNRGAGGTAVIALSLVTGPVILKAVAR